MFCYYDLERIATILELDGFKDLGQRAYERKVDGDLETTERIKVMRSCIILYIFSKENGELSDVFIFEGGSLIDYLIEVCRGLSHLRDRYYASV